MFSLQRYYIARASGYFGKEKKIVYPTPLTDEFIELLYKSKVTFLLLQSHRNGIWFMIFFLQQKSIHAYWKICVFRRSSDREAQSST